jgi:hypothetical protein
MAQYYRLPNPSHTSISVDGIEHHVDPDTGLLVVDVLTPGLPAELAERGAVLTDPAANTQPGLTPAEQAEREALFVELDAATGRRTDRRRSLQQLRQMKADLTKTGSSAKE